MIEIDHRQLHPDTLQNLLQEIILREGTDYRELSITEKISRFQNLLESNKAVIVFDAASGQCDIILKSSTGK